MELNPKSAQAEHSHPTEQQVSKKDNHFLGAAFLLSVTGISMLFGFGRTFANAKKQSPQVPENPHDALRLQLEGSALARRALGLGTIYAVTGVGLITFGIWKMSGAENFQDFRNKMGRILPRITNPNSKGRNEFESLTEFLQYVIDEDERAKTATASPQAQQEQKDES